MNNSIFYLLKSSKNLCTSTFFILLFFSLSILSSCEEITENLKIAPTIVRQPSNTAVNKEQTATFSVSVKGSAPLLYQWFKNGATIDGATDSIYTTEATTVNDNGASFTVKITNSEGNVTSQPAILTVSQQIPAVISFTTEGTSFSPLIEVESGATILWTFADQTTSNSATPTKNYGSAETRVNTLIVTPWSALKTINIGYDAGDGGSGSITHVANQNVSLVEGLQNVAPYLEIWCSSYNQIESLDFGNFVNIHTIECFLSQTLQSVNLNNTPRLKRACFEDCNLSSLDLSQSPALEDLRGAVNAYPTINFGTTGQHAWHICVRDNPQLTDQHVFQDMTQFPDIGDFYIWNDNQAGSLRIPSSSDVRGVFLMADGNHYTDVDLSGSLQHTGSAGTVSFRNNEITNINIAGCVQINEVYLENNHLSSAEGDELLTILDGLGRTRDETPEYMNLTVNLSGNTVPGTAGYAHAQNLATKGWTIITDSWTLEPGAPAETGADTIYFVTNGDETSMRCDFAGSPTAIWIWSNGDITTAVSGENVTKSGLGTGNHNNRLIISNGAALARFGASSGGGNGHLVSIADFNNSPMLRIIYAYNEPLFTLLGRSYSTRTREYHLMSTGLSTTAMDQIFADAVTSNVLNGTLYCNNMGTPASNANRTTLTNRGWSLQ